jgi:hypothetical protein
MRLLHIILSQIMTLAAASVCNSAWAMQPADSSSDNSLTIGSTIPTVKQPAESPKQEDEVIRTSLKSVADSAHHLQEALRNIVFEITRQRYVTAAEPNVVGPVVIPARPMPTGQIPIGEYLPPRQKYMTNFAGQVQSLLTMLIEEASTLPSNDSADSELSSELSLIKSHLEYLRAQNLSLQPLMVGPEYEDLAVGRVVVTMSDKLDEIKKLLKEAEHRVNKDIKHDPE